MDDARVVCHLHGLRHGNRDHSRVAQGQRSGTPVGQVAAVAELQREVRQSGLGFAIRVDLDDVRVPQPGNGFCLGAEAVELVRGRMRAVQHHLECNDAA